MDSAHTIRRVVTGHDADGKSVVVFDDVHDYKRRVQIWTTEGSPADNSGEVADAALRETRLEAPPQGSLFWMVELPPSRELASGAAAETAERLAAEGAVTHRDGHPGMHTTRTIDYMVVLDGEVTLLLDEGEVTLRKYDTVVQRGTAHHWENRGTEPARLAFVLLDAQPLP
ncbi:cupin domain-containing protein [Candidatus Poriferisocius sp.]|uniref:cupin domain-containing protein n=1 Tax=Candidatus Poriferisocius sp. TaxID=3101276 RepID=UPI003B01EAA5